MRIAFILDTFPALSETFILNQITGLIDRGHEVDIFASKPGDTTKVHEDVELHRLLERTSYASRAVHNPLFRLLKGILLTIIHGWKDPIALVRLAITSTEARMGERLALLYLSTPWFGRRPYDVVHCHYGPNGILGLRLREIGLGNGELVTTYYGYDVSRHVKLYGKEVYARLFAGGDRFLTVSQRMKDQLVALGCDAKKVRVHRLGIDCTKFHFVPRRVASTEPVRMISIARLVEKKGIEYGIRAVAKLVEAGKSIEYNIVGEGELREQLGSLVVALGVEDLVHLLGWRRQEEVVELLARSHIFLAPSVTGQDGDQEGVPVALTEAMAVGLPVVSTQHSGIPELVQDGESGFLVPERDAAALAEKLAHLLAHPEAWPEMGLAGRTFVEEHYNEAKLNDGLVEIYRDLITEENA